MNLFLSIIDAPPIYTLAPFSVNETHMWKLSRMSQSPILISRIFCRDELQISFSDDSSAFFILLFLLIIFARFSSFYSTWLQASVWVFTAHNTSLLTLVV